MAKKYWWQNVGNPDALVQAAAAPVSDQRIRAATAIRYAGAFQDEPEIARALVDSSVPTALAMRAFQGYSATKKQKVADVAAAAGYGPKSQEQEQKPITSTPAEEDSDVPWWMPNVAGTLGKIGLAIAGAAKTAGEGLLEGLNYIASPITASAQAGYASDTDLDRGLQSANDAVRGIPVVGDLFGGPTAAVTGLAGFVTNTVEGAGKIAFGGTGQQVDGKPVDGISEQQQADMRRAGYDPNSAASRYAYYFQEIGDKRSPVSDSAVAKLKQQFDPGDVDAAREIVASGALNDLARSAPALSDRARGLLDRASSRDAGAESLLKAMADNSQLTFGGKLIENSSPEPPKVGEMWGQGSTERTIGAALSDLVVYWYADPLVGAGALNKAAKFDAWGVDMSNFDNVAVAIRASDENFKPVGAVAKRFDQAMNEADLIVRLNQTGVAEDAVEAGQRYASWLKRYPSMRGAFDTLIGMRSGAIGKLRLRNEDEAAKEAERALETGRSASPWVIEAPSDGKPLWSFVDAEGKLLDDEAAAAERAKVADEMSAFLIAEAYSSGRELTGSRLLMPGQLSFNGALRDKLGRWGMDALMYRDESVMRQLDETRHTIDLDNVSTDPSGRYEELLNPASAEWMRRDYTFGVGHMFARGWRMFERTFSDMTINPVDPNSAAVFGRLVNQFMPKRQAQMVTSQYAAANPGERYAMLRQTIGSFLNVMNLRNTPEAQELVERLTKGLIPSDQAINGYRAGGREWYTTPDNNNIRVGEHRIAAAVHPWQLNEGIVLPNWREVRALVDRGKVLNAVLGTVGPWANSLNQTYKASKTVSPANAARQALEGFAFTAWRDPAVLAGYRKARAAVRADTLTAKVNDNDLQRLANDVTNFNAGDLDVLEHARRTSPEKYAETMRTLLRNNGFDEQHADVLTRLGEGVDLTGLASENTWGVARLAMAGPLDYVRKIRAERARRIGGDVNDTPLSRYLDQELAAAYTENAFKQLGSAADNYVTSSERIDRQAREQVFSGAGRGFTLRPAKLKNAYKWLGTKGKINHDMWGIELGKRLDDEIGRQVAQAIAQNHLGQATHDIDDMMFRLFTEDELGAGMRTNSARMQYLPNGELARSDAERQMAAARAAQDAVDDLVHHLGGTLTRDAERGRVEIRFNDESNPLLEKIAAGERPTVDDLAQLPHDVYPEGLVHTIQTPMPGGDGSMPQKLANLSSKAYGAVVAKPLAHMVLQPLYLAEKRIAYGEVEPLMQGLIDRGLTEGMAAYLLETMANNRAIARTFLVTDNPSERSVFSELGDKYLMFQRANEDFVRRLVNATKANPGALARANLMMTTAAHTGVVHYEPQQDEQGNTDYHLTFTYPGSALAQRVLMDSMVALGLAPEEALRVPQYDGLKSQVRFLNPGAANPIQFSANPVFGWAISGMEKIWPAGTIELERLRRGLQGGEDYGAGQSTLQQLTPAALQRFIPLMQKDDADGQFASAFRTAAIYAEAAGQLPGPDASPEERAKALDALKATATNILTLRAITGAFLPASPQAADPNGDSSDNLPDVDLLGRMQQLPNLRGEWFAIKSEFAKKYPDNYSRAIGEAQVEFAKRYPGELIVNPEAFNVGTVKTAGENVSGVPYTMDGTRWMLDNIALIRSNPTVALALIPRDTANGDFNNEAYKLQLKADLRTHKDLEQFYNDVTLAADITEFNTVRSGYFAAAREGNSKAVYAKMDAWEDGWRRTHPLASAELDRRAEPNFTHAEMAPALERIATGQAKLPKNMESYRDDIGEMYQDWATYRDKYLKVSFFDNGSRAQLNKKYRETGNQKWGSTPLRHLWSLMNVYEVN
ncbi:hypothetical protein [Lentzea sp. NBRC 102530]|uniref:hypothetical protein n=1 Tax=Lentzea sp. NBRC 102530 TaxID=3032201 RepID=UPI0024A21203|nr:hypothetical protein [Lentzea sp. NBRC 102530]GLY55323.1 hypothetical protein Lesp01_89780 [Lentzea sp. NBRC 102530]